MNWSNFIARTAVRRVIWILVGVVVYAGLGVVGIGKAHAAVTPTGSACVSPAATCNRGEAYADAELRKQQFINGGLDPAILKSEARPDAQDPSVMGFYCLYTENNGPENCGHLSIHYWNVSCPLDEPWHEPSKTCAKDCSAMAPLQNLGVRGSGTICQEGCKFAPKVLGPSDEGYSVCMNTADVLKPAFCGAGTWEPTGGTCTVPDAPEPFDPNKQTCRSTGGGFHECVKPDGTHCVTGPSGRPMCWGPNETGPKTTPEGTEGADSKPAPETPTPPPGLEDPTPNSTTSTTINNSTTNTTTYGGSGNSGSQPGTTPGQGGGGEGDGDGGDDDDDEGPGAPGAGIGEFYEPSGKTAASVVGEHVARAQASPMVSLAGDFLSANVSGSCPTWSMTFMGGTEVTIDFMCRPEFAQVLYWCRWFVLALFAWAAFRVGFL